MNKYEHAASSAKIFGGKPEDYEEFHALIDSNKTVTPSIFGRFFLHHFDVGLIILEKVFGKKIGPKKVPVKDLLAQHLLEDYGQLITFKDHWLPVLERSSSIPRLGEYVSFIEKAKKDPRLKGLKEKQLDKLDNFFKLCTISGEVAVTFSRGSMAIFGHALGADLAVKILGKKFYGRWTSDVVTGYLNCRFSWVDKRRDPVPTLLDWEKHLPDEKWMHAPKDYKNRKLDKEGIRSSYQKSKTSKKPKPKIDLESFSDLGIPYRRQPCNLD
jgi:hypothetical protein